MVYACVILSDLEQLRTFPMTRIIGAISAPKPPQCCRAESTVLFINRAVEAIFPACPRVRRVEIISRLFWFIEIEYGHRPICP